jgi:hypothetical protein
MVARGGVKGPAVRLASATENVPLVPVTDEFTVSVAVIVWFPSSSVALNEPVPFVSVLFAGKEAVLSLLVRCTVPP